MAYDEKLAERIEVALADVKGVSTRKMFGGLCFMVNGNMCCGVVKDRLMLRVGPEHYDEVLTMKGAAPMDFTGRPMKGMVFVEPAATKRPASVRKWVQLALDFVSRLPRKVKKKPG